MPDEATECELTVDKRIITSYLVLRKVVVSGFPNSYSGRSHFDRTYIFEHLVG